MKLDFNKPILGLDDQAIPESNLGKLVANVITSNTKGDAIKLYDWGRTLYKGEVLDLDRADQDVLKNLIKDSDSITILTKAQALEVFKKEND